MNDINKKRLKCIEDFNKSETNISSEVLQKSGLLDKNGDISKRYQGFFVKVDNK